jgi:CHAT domain-containing protein
VAPDGALHGLNLEALPMPGDEPRYWVEEATVSIAPSLAMLNARNGSVKKDKRLLLIGDPVGVDRSYPPLAYAAGEIAGITQRFGAERSVVISRERATPDVWRTSEPGGYSAIHFTAHATANRESPLDSAVLLAGGKLYARDVMATPLTADLVTVSACRGVGTRMYSGEGLVGFAWAFLHAGARNVIAGLWDVNDQSTSRPVSRIGGRQESRRCPPHSQTGARPVEGQSEETVLLGTLSALYGRSVEKAAKRRPGRRSYRIIVEVCPPCG